MEQTGNCMQFHQGDEKNPTLQEDVLANTPGNHHEYWLLLTQEMVPPEQGKN